MNPHFLIQNLHLAAKIFLMFDTRHHLKIAEYLSHSLDDKFQFGPISFGLDPIIGLIPIAGDIFTTALSFYIVWIGIGMKLPEEKIAQMIGNVVLDFLLDFIPVLGQIADFAFKSNIKNLEILKKYAPSDIFDSRLVKS